MKTNEWICLILFRIFYPIIFITASLVRCNVYSYIYGFLALLSCLVKRPNSISFKKWTGAFLIISLSLSFVMLLSQIVFQIFVASYQWPFNKNPLSNCSDLESALRQIGLQSVVGADILNSFRILLPDVLTFLTCLIIFIICRCLLEPLDILDEAVIELVTPPRGRLAEFGLLVKQLIGSSLVLCFFLITGIAIPSLLNCTYFVVFLICMTLWSCGISQGFGLYIAEIIMLIYSAMHISIIYLTQLQSVGEMWERNIGYDSLLGRLLGVHQMVSLDCSSPWRWMASANIQWKDYLNVGAIIGLFIVLSLKIRNKKNLIPLSRQPSLSTQALANNGERNDAFEIEHTGLINDQISRRNYQAITQPKENPKSAHNIFEYLRSFLLKQSYFATLIIMLAWSITYHSWLTFVYLVAACLIWTIPQKRLICMRASPFIVIYAEALLIIQYVYGLDLNDLELPVSTKSGYPFSEIGLVKYKHPFVPLVIMTLYTLIFWVTLRLFVLESNTTNNHNQEQKQSIGDFINSFLSKYWIFICVFLFLFISLQYAVIYRIVYMLLFVLFIILLKLNYNIWRNFLRVFWLFVILYSMFVLISIYIVQFEEVMENLHNSTGISYQLLEDIGFERYNTKDLFFSLLTPTSFLIVIILHMHYFQRNFFRMSDLQLSYPKEGVNTENKPKDIMFKSKLKLLWKNITILLWRLLEVHINKFVALTIFIVAINDVCVFNVLLIIFLVILFPLGFHGSLSFIVLMVSSSFVVFRMVFQLSLIDETRFYSNCSLNQSIINMSIAEYVGVEKTDNILYYVKDHVLLILILAFEQIIKLHQSQYYSEHNYKDKLPEHGLIFKDIGRKDADYSIKHCIMFMLNFAFYKFGKEICFLMVIVTMVIRMDVYSVIYGLMLLVLLHLNRRMLYNVWPIFICLIIFLIIVQYITCLGLPPFLCYEYPWNFTEIKMYFPFNLKVFLFLPDYESPPNSQKMIVDFFLLLFFSLQMQVFKQENTPTESNALNSNDPITPSQIHSSENPVGDFIILKNQYLDYVKMVVFYYSFWLTLLVLFITGTSRISLFCLFYLISSFLLFWHGHNFLRMDRRTIELVWRLLLTYCFLVIIVKSIFQLLGCVYIEKIPCIVISVFHITCVSIYPYQPTLIKCEVDSSSSVIFWDTVSFAFILLMIRIHGTWYYLHIKKNLDIDKTLSSRGGEIINESTSMKTEKRKKYEEYVLDNIHRKVERIRKSLDGDQNKNSYQDHYEVIRSGNYYMFENNDETELKSSENTEMDEIGRDPQISDIKKPPTPGDLINLLLTKGCIAALQMWSQWINMNHYRPIEPQESMDSSNVWLFLIEDSEDEVDATKQNNSESQQLDNQMQENSMTQQMDKLQPPSEVLNKVDATQQNSQDSQQQDNQMQENYMAQQMGDLRPPSKFPNKKSSNMFIKLRRYLRFILVFLWSVIEQIILTFDSISSDYISISKILREEKLKEMTLTNQRPIKNDVIEIEDEQHIFVMEAVQGGPHIDGHNEETDNKFHKHLPLPLRLLRSAGWLILSNSQLLCYFAMFLNALNYASIMSIVYPLSIFLWGSLCSPRPPKKFWLFLIGYTEAIIIIKYVFQLLNFETSFDPDAIRGIFFPPYVIGITKSPNFATYDIILLLCLFFHRSILNNHGLWKDPEETISNNMIVESNGIQPKYFEKIIRKIEKYLPKLNVNKSSQAATDVYVFIFLADFIIFLIAIFGFSSFGPSDYSTTGVMVTSVLKRNKIPASFLGMLLVQFVFIVIDRAIYLRKQLKGKLIFQIFLVLLVHAWIFFGLPEITQTRFVNNRAAQLWYFTKCIYFLLSAYQIRSGYPTCILGNFLTKNYNYRNLIMFQAFLAIPFVYELRSLMDWMFTDSTLALISWLQMEDIYASVFSIKCSRNAEQLYRTPRGQPKAKIIKYSSGGFILLFLIFIIWFPLLIFSLSTAIFVSNPPLDMYITLRVAGYEQMFSMATLNLTKMPKMKYNFLFTNYSTSTRTFLSGYQPNDIYEANFPSTSASIWAISPPNQNQLQVALNDSECIIFLFNINIRRDTSSGSDSVYGQFERKLMRNVTNDFDIRKRLLQIITGSTNESVDIYNLFPLYLMVPSTGRISSADGYFTNNDSETNSSNLLGSLRLNLASSTSGIKWWSIQQLNPFIDLIGGGLLISTFNERVAPSGVFSIINNYGVIGLYISLVLVIGRFVRIFVQGLSYKIMFVELPDPQPLLTLCHDIYMVRESGRLNLEEELFSQLLFLYRSPETLLKVTRQKIKQE